MPEPPLLERASELFNRKKYFECHDLLEDAWTGTRGPERDFLQGLIHTAVGMYHIAAENYKGAVSQLGAGVVALERFRPEREGLDVDGLLAGVWRCLEKSEQAEAMVPSPGRPRTFHGWTTAVWCRIGA